MTPTERARWGASRAVNPEAYDAYLRGRYLLAGLAETEAQTSRALAEFERAVAIDPSYAPAHAGIAKAQQLRATVFQGAPPSEIRGPAIRAARRALALDPDLAEAHAILARLQLSEFDWPGAEASFQRLSSSGKMNLRRSSGTRINFSSRTASTRLWTRLGEQSRLTRWI
jgi:tetratricopeptide (TPR) repeat protein